MNNNVSNLLQCIDIQVSDPNDCTTEESIMMFVSPNNTIEVTTDNPRLLLAFHKCGCRKFKHWEKLLDCLVANYSIDDIMKFGYTDDAPKLKYLWGLTKSSVVLDELLNYELMKITVDDIIKYNLSDNHCGKIRGIVTIKDIKQLKKHFGFVPFSLYKVIIKSIQQILNEHNNLHSICIEYIKVCNMRVETIIQYEFPIIFMRIWLGYHRILPLGVPLKKLKEVDIAVYNRCKNAAINFGNDDVYIELGCKNHSEILKLYDNLLSNYHPGYCIKTPNETLLWKASNDFVGYIQFMEKYIENLTKNSNCPKINATLEAIKKGKYNLNNDTFRHRDDLKALYYIPLWYYHDVSSLIFYKGIEMAIDIYYFQKPIEKINGLFPKYTKQIIKHNSMNEKLLDEIWQDIDRNSFIEYVASSSYSPYYMLKKMISIVPTDVCKSILMKKEMTIIKNYYDAREYLLLLNDDLVKELMVTLKPAFKHRVLYQECMKICIYYTDIIITTHDN